MDMCRYFLCFLLFSFIGWAYESAYYTLQQKKPVNSGFLNGCCCPIYGIGGLLDLMLLGGIENPLMLFIAGLVLTCSLEYFVSWLLEALFKKRWWDYTNWPLNINGRVCIVSGAVFGIMTVFLIKFIAPETFRVITAIPDGAAHIAAAAAAALIIADIIITIHNSESFGDKLWYVREQAKIFDGDGSRARLMNSLCAHDGTERMRPIKSRLARSIPDRGEIFERIRKFFKR